MASTIRVRATSSGETTEVQALIQHPMDSGFVKDAKGEIIPPHFIQELTFEYDGKSVFVADWGAAVSKDPRSEEHTSELQSLRHLVCRLLLEKKKKQTQ